MLKAIIFDFDGVIWDTYDINFSLSQFFDPSISEQDFQDHHNGNVFEQPKIRFKPEDIPIFFTKQKELFSRNHFFPIIDIIPTLGEKFKLFIVSSTLDANIVGFLELAWLNIYFQKILWKTTHKSKIEKFKMIFQEYGISENECVFITDTIGDIKEAKHLNIPCIAVNWWYHSLELLENEKPFAIAKTPEDIIQSIKYLANNEF